MRNDDFSRNGGLSGELQRFIKDLQKQIAEASGLGENGKIFTLADRLRRADALMQKHDGIGLEIKELICPESSASATDHPEPSLTDLPKNGSDSNGESRKERGERLRRKWLEKHGKTLKWVRGALYRNSKGEVVGIACAKEKIGPTGPKGRWWLGLQSAQFQSAVLLCEMNNGHVHGVCLPYSFIDSYRGRFSKSANGQEQFNILKNDAKWHLQLPVVGAVDVTMYVDNPATLI